MSAHHVIQNDGSAADCEKTVLELCGQMVMGEDSSITVPLRFSYRTNDPYVVTLEFLGEFDDRPTVVWELSRDLLCEGLGGLAGLGDVRIWPPGCRYGGQMSILLMGPENVVLLELPFSRMRTWLVSKSLKLVPLGTESRLIDWDAVLRRLLADS